MSKNFGSFGEAILFLREKSSFSATELALKIGKSYKTIENWESRKSLPPSTSIEMICGALGEVLESEPEVFYRAWLKDRGKTTIESVSSNETLTGTLQNSVGKDIRSLLQMLGGLEQPIDLLDVFLLSAAVNQGLLILRDADDAREILGELRGWVEGFTLYLVFVSVGPSSLR